MTDPFMARYTNANAAGYDRTRETTDRWKAEEAAFPQLIAETGARSVIDCPFGTGRWYPHYLSLAGPVIGIDRSTDMLTRARAMMGPAGDRITLIEGDAFALTSSGLPRVDLIVCTRFVNWLDFALVETLLAGFTALQPRHLILGATVLSRDASPDLRAGFERFLATPQDAGKAVVHVHEETRVLDTLHRLGWSERRRVPIFQRTDRENFFYLLGRLQ